MNVYRKQITHGYLGRPLLDCSKHGTIGTWLINNCLWKNGLCRGSRECFNCDGNGYFLGFSTLKSEDGFDKWLDTVFMHILYWDTGEALKVRRKSRSYLKSYGERANNLSWDQCVLYFLKLQ